MDLADYALDADPQQRQAIMAELLRARARGQDQADLARAWNKSRRFDDVAAVSAMANNPQLAAAAAMMQKNAASFKPQAMGNQGYMLPETGQFIESPIFQQEKQAQRDLSRDNIQARLQASADAARERNSLTAALAAMRDNTTREGYALRSSIAAQGFDLRRELAGAKAAQDKSKADEKAAEAAKGKVLNPGEARRLADKETAVLGFQDLHDTFKDSYAGAGSDVVAKIQNQLGAKQPLGFGEGYADQSNWWKNYAEQRNIVRHALFGSALTAVEKAAFDEQTITEGMESKEIKRRLAQQHKIAVRAYNKLKGAYANAGFNMEKFADMETPLDAPLPGEKPPKSDSAPAGVDQNIWNHMTPQEKSLWKK